LTAVLLAVFGSASAPDTVEVAVTVPVACGSTVTGMVAPALGPACRGCR
jgi:hypothetical protein